ncbi:MAG: sugar transporter [Segetibacter sp.]|nr:sugar transporter [Segetibacter sp.]
MNLMSRKTLNPSTKFPKVSLGLVALLTLIITGTSSCYSTQKAKYFATLSDSTYVPLANIKKQDGFIQPDDMLEIKIAGANEATTALFNTYSSVVGSETGSKPAGYIIDSRGEIEFPIIGKVKASGLTKEEFSEKLKKLVAKYLKDPLVSVRFTNFRFTVLGEVKAPGSFSLPNEQVTILQALGLAGDITSYGKRDNVKVIRENSTNRHIGTVSFSDKSLFTSPYYFLQRNDVVYVEPDKTKGQWEQTTRVASIVATIAGLIAVTLTIFR